MSALEDVVNRPDEQSRREAAQGLAAAGGDGPLRLLATLTEDSSMEVAVATVRAMAKYDTPGAANVLSTRLDSLDVDGKDFALAREIIGALARVSDPQAEEALKRISSRRALIKRGHYAEIQDLAKQALALREERGASR